VRAKNYALIPITIFAFIKTSGDKKVFKIRKYKRSQISSTLKKEKTLLQPYCNPDKNSINLMPL
jgi:hypothetical protein